MQQGLLERIWKKKHAYLFISPFFILFAVFMLFPFVYSFWISLHNWDGISIPTFVGLANYRDLLRDELFWKSLYNTVYILVLNIPLQLGLALVLAVVLNSEVVRGRTTMQLIYFMPIIVSVVVVAIVFSLLYDSYTGLINYFLEWLGLQAIPWLSSEAWSKLSIVLLITWRWTGYNMVILLAGLQAIPHELYEAGLIDGTNAWKAFRHITLPLIKPVLLFCLIMSIIGLFKIFTEPYILTFGGPNNSSQTMVTYIYNNAFRYSKLGYGSALAYVLFLIVLVASVINLKAFGGNPAE
ncbi:MAG: sugar ABC transporter permease [Firmicutes bacterium]|nr:sugar ABC transporter permease [Bacillota bacterium]